MRLLLVEPHAGTCDALRRLLDGDANVGSRVHVIQNDAAGFVGDPPPDVPRTWDLIVDDAWNDRGKVQSILSPMFLGRVRALQAPGKHARYVVHAEQGSIG